MSQSGFNLEKLKDVVKEGELAAHPELIRLLSNSSSVATTCKAHKKAGNILFCIFSLWISSLRKKKNRTSKKISVVPYLIFSSHSIHFLCTFFSNHDALYETSYNCEQKLNILKIGYYFLQQQQPNWPQPQVFHNWESHQLPAEDHHRRQQLQPPLQVIIKVKKKVRKKWSHFLQKTLNVIVENLYLNLIAML